MADEKRDYYEVLGVDKSADDAAIKKAYRAQAKKYHPDLHPGDAEAEKKFKEINEAYAVLSDSEKKAKYDQYGHAAFDPNMGGGGGFGGFGGFDFGGSGGGFDIFGDIFGSMFGGGGSSSARRNGPVRGNDTEISVTISFEEAAFGVKKTVSYNRIEKCSDCSGSGAKKGTKAETCQTCHGTGQVRVTQRTPLGMMQTTTTCDACRGTGKIIKEPCNECRGKGYVRVKKTLEVSIPAGIDDGQMISLGGQGDEGRNGGPAGDLIIVVSVRPHRFFERRRMDLYCDIPITFPEAALGAELEIPTLEEPVKYTIPEGTQTGTRFKLKGLGIVNVNNPKLRGDIYFTVTVEVPKNLSAKQKETLRAFSEECGDGHYQKKKSFFDKLFKK
ncbi:MAG: molecular chaperone DnaJ [Clostridia bacterium]|nr:molecular chaperone DnaJ [Clostridia bacterium]